MEDVAAGASAATSTTGVATQDIPMDESDVRLPASTRKQGMNFMGVGGIPSGKGVAVEAIVSPTRVQGIHARTYDPVVPSPVMLDFGVEMPRHAATCGTTAQFSIPDGWDDPEVTRRVRARC